MINYNLLAHAVGHYEAKGYKQIEVPWTVSENIDDITKPADRIHYQLKHNDKCLIGSGEVGFLYLYCKDYLPKGRYQTVTPCWRDEPYDGMHAKCFMKNELIITDEVNNDTLKQIIDDAVSFFSQYVEVEVIETEIGYDIVSKEGGYELGSYGIRHCEYMDWVYGTGCAEPRLSRVMKSIILNRIYGKKNEKE